MRNTSFWLEYKKLVSQLLPPLSPTDGLSEQQISQAEQRLGINLPHLLREYYSLTANRPDINHTHDRLLALSDLYVNEGKLIFFEENQGVMVWGINIDDANSDNPAVFHANVKPDLFWELDQGNLSNFFVAMLFWQAVNGGMAYTGIGIASSDAIASVNAEWTEFNLGESWRHRAFLRDSQILYIVGAEDNPEVYAGGRTEADFLAIETFFDVSWEYATLYDENGIRPSA